MAKARRNTAGKSADPTRPLRVTRGTLARVASGRVIATFRPTTETQRRLDILMAAVNVVPFDGKTEVPDEVPDTFEKLFDRAVEQFLDLYHVEPEFKFSTPMGPAVKRRHFWLRGDLMIRVEKVARECGSSAARVIETAIDTYVDHYTRGIQSRLIASFAATAQKILDASESTGRVLRDRERKARKLMRTGQA